jgi:flagellar hook-length control protein FliK
MNVNNMLVFSGDAGGGFPAGLQSLAGAGLQGTKGTVNGAAAGYAGSLFQQLIMQMLAAKGQAEQAADETGGTVQDMAGEADSGFPAGMLLTEGNLSGISLTEAGALAGGPGGPDSAAGSLTGELSSAVNSGQADGMQALIMAMTGAAPVLNGSLSATGSQMNAGMEAAADSSKAAAAGVIDAAIPASLKSLFAGGVRAAVPAEAGVPQEEAGAGQSAWQAVVDEMKLSASLAGNDGKTAAGAAGQAAVQGGGLEAAALTGIDPEAENPSQQGLNAKSPTAVSGLEAGVTGSGSGEEAAGTGSPIPEAAAAKPDRTAEEAGTADSGRIAQGYQNLHGAGPVADAADQNSMIPSAEKAEPYSQIRDEILAKLEQKGPTEFKMQLEPADLGQIDVNLKLSEGKLVIDIMAANSRTHALLASQVDKLIAGMGLSNVQVESVQVNQQMNSQSQDSGQGQGYQANAGMDFSQNRQQEQFQNELFKNGTMTGTFGLPQQEAQDSSQAGRIEAFRRGSHRMDYTV